MVWLKPVSFAPVGVKMERNEVDTASDSAAGHLFDEIIPGNPDRVVKADDVSLPGVEVSIGGRSRQDDGQVA